MATKSNGVEVVRIGAGVPREVLDALKAIAATEDRSISYVIRRAVDREIALAGERRAA